MEETKWDEQTFEGRWCINSETGDYYLIDLKTGKLLLRKENNGKVTPLGRICEKLKSTFLSE